MLGTGPERDHDGFLGAIVFLPYRCGRVWNELERAALRLGMHYRHLPIATPQMAGGAAVQFARVLESSPQPVLAFCRSGGRSLALFEAAARL